MIQMANGLISLFSKIRRTSLLLPHRVGAET